MAENKKKHTAKKTTDKKVDSKKHADHKKAAISESTKKKGSHKEHTKKKATATSKVEHKKPKHTSKKVEDDENPWMATSIILGILVVLLIGAIGYMYFNQSNDVVDTDNNVVDNTDDEQTLEDNNQVNGADNTANTNVDGTEEPDMTSDVAAELLIVEDPACENCQVDLFAQQVKENLFPNLEVEKVNFESTEGKAIIEELELTQVPAYIFSEDISQRDDWDAQLSQAFIEVEVKGVKKYMLNPQIIPYKVMVEAPIITDNAIVVGDVNAPVTVIEFSDFECPFCGIADGNEELLAQFRGQNPTYEPPMPKVYEEYVESGQVKVVFYNYPIEGLHPQVMPTHLAAMCANEQGEWKEYSHMIWMGRSEWSDSTANREAIMKEYAVELGLDEEQFNECLDSKKYADQIASEIELGQSYGVTGTPAFFVGKTFVSGAQDYESFKALIEVELGN